jgi:hypothetical protein
MMSINRSEQTTVVLPCNTERLEDVLELLDELHTAATEGEAFSYAEMNRAELLDLLREIVFTAQETINEIHATKPQKMPVLRLVEKQSKAG